MKVIKHGNRIKEEVFTCPQCGCEFIPGSTEFLRLDGKVYAYCPECAEKIEKVSLPKDFDEEETELEKHHRRREELVSTIVDFIEFDRIHTAMEALDWKWWDCGIPTAERIKEEVIRRLREAFDKKESFFSGGIYIEYLPKDENGDEGLKFAFVTENYGAFYDNSEKIVTIP
jgi:predicted RNA-binding Zn-ribbon protein involved in translation (DUF1610 family)